MVTMDAQFNRPPKSKADLTPSSELIEKLRPLVGKSFALTGKSRTDGSNIRKLVAEALKASLPPQPADPGEYLIVPPKGKGVPKILLEYVDTYIVTTGSSYNLQVWNRNPASASVQVEYTNGDTLKADEVRFIFCRVDPKLHVITSVIVLSPDYIVREFGIFGKPTIKHQLIRAWRTTRSQQ